jgi:hypothetical protein
MARAGLLDIDGGHANLVRRRGGAGVLTLELGLGLGRGSGGGGKGGAKNSSADLGRSVAVFACRQHQDGGSGCLVCVCLGSREGRAGNRWVGKAITGQAMDRREGCTSSQETGLAWLAVVVVVARLGLHHGMADGARGVQDERGWGSVGHAVGKQWAVWWRGRGAVLSGGAGVGSGCFVVFCVWGHRGMLLRCTASDE